MDTKRAASSAVDAMPYAGVVGESRRQCDLKYPSCSNCMNAQKPCLTYDVGKQAEIPRNYVSYLEAQVQDLSREIQGLRAQNQRDSINRHQSVRGTLDGTHAPADVPADSEDANGLVNSVRNVIVEPSKHPRFLGPSSGITLATMVLAAIKGDSSSLPVSAHEQASLQRYSSAITDSPAAEASSLPPRHAADHLVEVYFQYRTPHLPIIQLAQAKKAIDNAFISNGADGQQAQTRASSAQDIFISYMVFAIALCNVPSPTGGTGRPMQSEGCFRSAIYEVEKVITYSKSDLETLRAVLLLAQFVSMCPWRGSLWHLTGIALRLCVDMGLHWETDEQALSLGQDLLYERRRLWYSACHFDRVLAITLGRPFGITDESTRVSLPNPWAVSRTFSHSHEPSDNYSTHHQRAHNHLFTMAQLECEIKHVQNSQTWPLKLAYPKPNYTAWVQEILSRLREWFGTIPSLCLAHPMSIFASQPYWDMVYNNTILLLHRPPFSTQTCSPEPLSISFDASTALIASIKLLQRDGRLDVLWKSTHDLFMAGLTVIFCVWESATVRSSQPASKIIETLQSCASTLSAMSVNFSGAIGCRDAFDTLSAATVDWLLMSASDVAEMGRSKAHFEKQVGDLLQPLGRVPAATSTGSNERSPHVETRSVNDMSTIFSSDTFSFGEMLSLAAQWPDLEDIMGFDATMTGMGTNYEGATI